MTVWENVVEESGFQYYDPTTDGSGTFKNVFQEADEDYLNGLKDISLREASDKEYRKITKRIIDISEKYLNKSETKKTNLREDFKEYFKKILTWQIVLLTNILILDSFIGVPFDISDSVLNTFMVSVFVETLGVIGYMITFAFSSKEENEIVKVLTSIVESFQKYNGKDRK